MTDPITRFVGGPAQSTAARLADRGVRFVLGTAVDYAGVTRAKGVPIDRFPVMVDPGVGASPSWLAFGVDAAIAFTPMFGVIGDLRLRIDAAATTIVDHGVAWAPADFFEQTGLPSAACPRGRLRRVVRQLEEHDLVATTGTEVEFVLTAPDGSRRATSSWQGYGVRPMLEVASLMTDLTESFDGAGIPIQQLHAEYGADQFELSLPPADPLTTADRTILARVLIGRAVARHGLGVSFSPAPFAGGAGSGAHLHLSLNDAEGPLLSGGDGPHGLTARGGSVMAGVLAHLAGLQAVLAGSVVSGLRLKPGNWAGAFACWGLENREAAVRLVADTPGNPTGATIEIKIIDASANPYLAAAAVLGMALAGVRAGLELPTEVAVDPATLPGDRGSAMALPVEQAEVLQNFQDSALARELLGDPIVDGTLAVRRHERDAYGTSDAAAVTEVFRQAFSC